MPAQTFPISQFQGLNERLVLGSSLQQTTSLDNVLIRNGTVKGRKGIALWDGISTAASTSIIIGLTEFYAPASATSSLIRMQTTKLEKWNSGTHAWDDITGTALTGTTSTRPCFATMSDEGFLVFTNEGHDQPRKYTGSGNSATLGGTPPYCKWLEPYAGFLFLFNTSVDGTFSLAPDPVTSYFSDVPDTDWALCEGNSIVYDDTEGEIRAAMSIADNLVVFKSDAVITTRFVGGITRFNKRRLPFSQGILAPLSLQRLGEFGLIWLATDYNLYVTDGQTIRPLPLAVQKSLRETMAASVAANVSGYVDLTNETYHLLYQRNGSTYYDGRLSYNYRTGEFTRGAYTGWEFTRALGYRQSNNVNSQLVVAASDKKVYEQESGTDDAATAVSRYIDIDWNQYGTPGSKWLTGGNFLFTRSTNTQVRISVATDHSHIFQYQRMYSLKGKFPSDAFARVKYELPSPVYGNWFKIRIEFFHYGSTNVVELLEAEPIIIPVSQVPQDQSRQSQAQRA